MWTEACEGKFCIGECDLCDVWDDEEMEDECDEDEVTKEPHFASGFHRTDRPYLEGYYRGLGVAMRFCDNEQDVRAIKMKLDKVAKVLLMELDWLEVRK